MEFIAEWGKIAGIAGIALGIFAVLFREVIRKNIFPKLSRKQSFIILLTFMALISGMSVFAIVKYYDGESEAPGQVTVLVHGEKGKDNLVLPNRGKVTLIYGDENTEETINAKGEATFKQIPAAFFNKGATVEIQFFDPEGEPYRTKNPDSLYTLTKGKYIALSVKLYGLTTLYGIVKDFSTGEPVEGVRISVRGVETFSNEYGGYKLEIPPEHQRKFQTVRAFKEGYEFFEMTNVPVQTESEFPILLKLKK